MNYSFWEKDFITRDTDFTILGAGIVGLSTAISIKEKSPHSFVKIIERGAMPYGASTKNAGFSCFGSISELIHDKESMGETDMLNVVNMRYEGLKHLRDRCGDDVIHYRQNGGTEVFRKQDALLRDRCIDAMPWFNEIMHKYLDIKPSYSVGENTLFPNFDKKTIVNDAEGSINPMKMMNRLLSIARSLGIDINLGIEVDEVDLAGRKLITRSFDIPYNHLIVCTNGFTKRLLPNVDVTGVRNQVLITKPIRGFELPSCYHMDGGYVYFRSYDERILLGGGRNIDLIGESTDQFGTTDTIMHYLQEILNDIYPSRILEIDHTWSGILGVGPSKFPICEHIDDHASICVRMGGMGIAIGSYLGDEMAEMVLG